MFCGYGKIWKQLLLIGVFVFIFSKFGWSFWWVLGFLWFAPWLWSKSGFWGDNNRDTADPKRKRKNDEFDPSHYAPPAHETLEKNPHRRLIRTADGEFLVAVEDPHTGILYLEDPPEKTA
jgi:hypothetical protein